MSLNFGAIHGSIELKTSSWTKGLDQAYKAGDQMVAKSKTSFAKGGDQAGRAFTDGVQRSTRGVGAVVGRLADGAKGMFAQAGDRAGAGFTDGVGKGTAGVGDKMRDAINVRGGQALVGAAAAVGALVGVAFSAAVGQYLDVERATSRLTAQLGLTPGRALVIGRLAGRMYAQGFGEDVTAVTDGIRASFNAGLLPADALSADIERVSGKLVTMADVLEMDVGMTAEAVGNMLRNGLAKDADEAFDILAAGAQAGADKAGDLAQTFQEYSTQFRQMGLSGAEAMGMLQQGLQGGARDADVVADAIKEMAVRSAGEMSKTTTVANTSAAALQRVVSAERNLEAQGRASMRAQKALTDARAEAAQQLKDLADQTGDAALDEEQAAINVLRAQERLNNLDPNASALDRREAILGLQMAQEALGDQQKKVLELKDATAKANAEGVDGSEKVINAMFGVMEAQRDQDDATADLLRSNVELSQSYGGTRTELTALGKAYQRLGIDGAQAQRDIAKGGEPARKVLERVLDGLRGIEDPMLRNSTAIEIFGTKAEDLQGALYGLDPDTAVASLGQVAGAADGLGVAYDNTVDKFEIGKRNILSSADGLVSELVGMFADGEYFDPKNFGYGWEKISNIARTSWSTLTASFESITNRISGWWNNIAIKVSGFAIDVYATVNNVVSWFRGLPDRISDAASGMWDGIKESFKSAINWIIDAWNGLSLTMPSVSIPGVGSVGGWTLNTPNIPRFHTGTGPGGVPGRPGQEVPALLMAGETVRTVGQERSLQAAIARMGAAASAGMSAATNGGGVAPATVSGGNVMHITVPVTITGPVAGRDGAKWVRDQVNEGVRTGAINVDKMLRRRAA